MINCICWSLVFLYVFLITDVSKIDSKYVETPMALIALDNAVKNSLDTGFLEGAWSKGHAEWVDSGD